MPASSQNIVDSTSIDSWWEDAFPIVPYKKSPPAQKKMLTLVAYDISNPKRLNKVAKTCLDFGVRVQYSIFECHLDEEKFQLLWDTITSLILPSEDKLVAYRIDAKSAKSTMTAGSMVCSEKALCYLVA